MLVCTNLLWLLCNKLVYAYFVAVLQHFQGKYSMNFDFVKAQLPLSQLIDIARQYPQNEHTHHNGLKYINKLNVYLREKVDIFNYLECRRPGIKHILDIGSGSGFFGFICKLAGYPCVNTNERDYPIFRQTLQTLGLIEDYFKVFMDRDVVCVEHALDREYDVITCMRTVFNYYPHNWRLRHWLQFFHCICPLLSQHGQLFVKTNYSPGELKYILPDQVKDCFVKYQVNDFYPVVTWHWTKKDLVELCREYPHPYYAQLLGPVRHYIPSDHLDASH